MTIAVTWSAMDCCSCARCVIIAMLRLYTGLWRRAKNSLRQSCSMALQQSFGERVQGIKTIVPEMHVSCRVFACLNARLEVASMLFVSDDGSGPRIHDFCTVPFYRNRGMGTQLLEYAFDWLKSNGHTEVALIAQRDMGEGLVRYYEKRGFVSTGLTTEIGTELIKSI